MPRFIPKQFLQLHFKLIKKKKKKRVYNRDLNHVLTIEEQLGAARISEVAEHCSLNETVCPSLKDVKCIPSLTEKEKKALLIHLAGNR